MIARFTDRIAGGITAKLTEQGQRPLRFAAAGIVNTLFGLGIYPLLLWGFPVLRTHYMAALGIAQVVSLCFAFTTHKLGVFRTQGNVLREFGSFASFYLVHFSANWAVLPMLVEWGGVPPVMAQFGFALVLIVTSWFWHSRVTFRTTGSGG